MSIPASRVVLLIGKKTLMLMTEMAWVKSQEMRDGVFFGKLPDGPSSYIFQPTCVDVRHRESIKAWGISVRKVKTFLKQIIMHGGHFGQWDRL